MIRKIIHIDEEKCNGCGLCATACHEGAIDIINGKAKLVRENFCDGFGDCLPGCPTGAITFEEREAPAYDEAAVQENKKKKELQETYLLDRREGQPVPPYRQCGDAEQLKKAFGYLKQIQAHYHISVKNELHIQDYLCKAGDMHRKYPVSPKDLWYRMGEVFACCYKMQSFYNQDAAQTQSAFMNAVFYHYLALQWAVHTRQSGNNRNEIYDYIAKAATDILRLHGTDSIMADSLKPIRERTTDPVLIR